VDHLSYGDAVELAARGERGRFHVRARHTDHIALIPASALDAVVVGDAVTPVVLIFQRDGKRQMVRGVAVASPDRKDVRFALNQAADAQPRHRAVRARVILPVKVTLPEGLGPAEIFTETHDLSRPNPET